MSRIRGDLLERSFTFAVRILELVDQLPNGNKGWALAKQLCRCGPSIGANLHEADHAFSTQDFAHKCNVALKEAAETHYWLKLCVATRLLREESVESAIAEANELRRVLASIVKKTQLPV